LLTLAAATSGDLDVVEVIVLCWSKSGSLHDIEIIPNIRIVYLQSNNVISCIPKLIKEVIFRRYFFIFSSAAHINALCSILRALGIMRTDYLVCRESTSVFHRHFGKTTNLIRALYYFYGRQDLIICQTELMRRQLNENTNHRYEHLTRVVENPIDVEAVRVASRAPALLQSSSFDNFERLVVWCGRLIPVKNPLLAVDALALLDSRVGLIMIGDGPLELEVRARSREKDVESRLLVVGRVQNPYPYMARAKVGLITSVREGFPNVALEMAACGASRVVATPCAGGLEDLDFITLADATAEGIAEAIKLAFCHDSGERSESLLRKRDPGAYWKAILSFLPQSGLHRH
jgi:glycosyltransferase involved in cell wall biosynthesis